MRFQSEHSGHSHLIDCLLHYSTDIVHLNGVSWQTRWGARHPQILTNVPWHIIKFACKFSSCPKEDMLPPVTVAAQWNLPRLQHGTVQCLSFCSIAESVWCNRVQHCDSTSVWNVRWCITIFPSVILCCSFTTRKQAYSTYWHLRCYHSNPCMLADTECWCLNATNQIWSLTNTQS